MSKSHHEYGQFYFYVQLNGKAGHSAYVHADEVRVTDSGDLLFLSRGRRKAGMKTTGPMRPLFGVSTGHWKYFYGASLIDGTAVSVEKWGE